MSSIPTPAKAVSMIRRWAEQILNETGKPGTTPCRSIPQVRDAALHILHAVEALPGHLKAAETSSPAPLSVVEEPDDSGLFHRAAALIESMIQRSDEDLHHENCWPVYDDENAIFSREEWNCVPGCLESEGRSLVQELKDRAFRITVNRRRAA